MIFLFLLNFCSVFEVTEYPTANKEYPTEQVGKQLPWKLEIPFSSKIKKNERVPINVTAREINNV